jgi:hypothetical protein
VDFISEFIVSCMLDIKFSNHKTYHLINRSHVSMSILSQAASRCGFNLTKLSPGQWCSTVDAESPEGLVLAQEPLELLLGHHHDILQDNVTEMLERFDHLSSVVQ